MGMNSVSGGGLDHLARAYSAQAAASAGGGQTTTTAWLNALKIGLHDRVGQDVVVASWWQNFFGPSLEECNNAAFKYGYWVHSFTELGQRCYRRYGSPPFLRD
jgi:hypothetical protein